MTADHKTVKLADFGLAREESVTEMMTAETGTYRWMAPEVKSRYFGVSMQLLFDSSLHHFVYLVAAIQYSHSTKWREEALQSQGGCL